jgi:hypothetical protein
MIVSKQLTLRAFSERKTCPPTLVISHDIGSKIGERKDTDGCLDRAKKNITLMVSLVY